MSDHEFEGERREEARADDTDRLVTVIRKVVHDEVKARTAAWPKKNGDGLLGYLGRLITPERIALAFLLAYQVGGRVQEITTEMRNFEKKNSELAIKVEDVGAQIERLGHAQQAAAALAEKQDTAIGELRARSVALDNRLRLTVTRSELKEAVEQRILPRLDRIENR